MRCTKISTAILCLIASMREFTCTYRNRLTVSGVDCWVQCHYVYKHMNAVKSFIPCGTQVLQWTGSNINILMGGQYGVRSLLGIVRHQAITYVDHAFWRQWASIARPPHEPQPSYPAPQGWLATPSNPLSWGIASCWQINSNLANRGR